MNPVESDLEEGEILDSPSPCSSSSSSDKKPRRLPRRYVVHEKPTPIHKHKKDCKYAIHYHAKRLSKLKKSPKSKDYHKRHKSTCPHEKSRRPAYKSSTNVEKNFSKIGHSFSNYSLIAEIKESIKDHSIKHQSTKHLPQSEKNISETQKGSSEKNKNDDFKSEIGRENADVQSGTKLNVPKQCNQPSVNSINDISNEIEIIEINSDNDNDNKVSFNNANDSSPKDKNEESEDEEELRRIALATFTKRKAATESSENLSKTAENISASVEPSNINDIQISQSEVNSPASDNYEVVDMEVDEDIQASIEILENSEKSQSSEVMEDLFVIDTKPSEDFKENTLPELHNSSDDDFETDILRAELIESLCRKKCLKDEYIEEEKSNSDVHQKQIPTVPEKKNLGKYKKLNPNFYRKQQLRPSKHVLRKNVNKAQNLLCKIKNKALNVNNKPPAPPIQVKEPPERLVIALNDESSSEDSDDSESENPVASIEALISDCRQKSDSCEKTQKIVANVPKAVSCLSKAQQEEYTSLVKILAKKEKLQAPDTFQPNKNGSGHSLLDDLKLLEGKLIGFNEALKKKKELMSYLLKEINSKKILYMKSKLTAQHLKEQYIAAEKIRKANLCAWSKSCSDFKSVKRTVSNLESKIVQLQTLCSKLGATIQGQTYNLPSLPTGNR